MKPICVPCQRFFRVKKNGVHFIEGMPRSNNAQPGTTEPENWKPYKLWVGDRWECAGCGAVILVGFGQRPIAEHYQDTFTETAADAEMQVNDC